MPAPPRHAFTLVEAAVSTMLIAGLGVAVMQVISSTGAANHATMSRRQGIWLAERMMAELDGTPYGEPAGAIAVKPADRKGLADIGDYHGLVDAPPSDHGGAALPGFESWDVRVQVEPITAAAPDAPVVGPTSLLRVTVEARRAGKPVGRIVRIRAAAAEGALDLGGDYTLGADAAASGIGVMP